MSACAWSGQFDAPQLARDTVERWSGHFTTLLVAAVDNPGERVSCLPLLTAEEREQLLFAHNQTEAACPAACIHELIAAQAARTPERIAVRCGERQLSYRALNEHANQLAHYSRRFDVGPDVPVGVCLQRSVEALMAMLAILKAGSAYLPVSPTHPPARLAQQLRHARVVITEEGLLPPLPDWSGSQIHLGCDHTQWQQEPYADPALATSGENLVYLLHTSGSTGMPKAVVVRHRNLVNYAHHQRPLGVGALPGRLAVCNGFDLDRGSGKHLHFSSPVVGWLLACDSRRHGDAAAGVAALLRGARNGCAQDRALALTGTARLRRRSRRAAAPLSAVRRRNAEHFPAGTNVLYRLAARLLTPSFTCQIVMVSAYLRAKRANFISPAMAYLVSAGEALDAAMVRAQLACELPDYMVPSHLIAVEELPLTINGKLDRSKLPLPQLAHKASDSSVGRAITLSKRY